VGEVDVRHVREVEACALGRSLSDSFPAEQYAQVRLAVSQTYFLEGRPWRWETLKKFLLESLAHSAMEVKV
jgi:hypothetical protein